MVSAVFHGPFEVASSPAPASSSSPQPHNALKSIAEKDHSTLGSMEKILKTDESTAAPAPGIDWRGKARDLLGALLPPLMGLGLLISIWAIVSITTKSSIPSPLET